MPGARRPRPAVALLLILAAAARAGEPSPAAAASPSAAAAAARPYEGAALLEKTSTPAVARRLAQQREMAARGDTRALAKTLDRLSEDPEPQAAAVLDVAARERLLFEGVLALQATPPSPAARALLQRLAHRPARVYVQHAEPGHHRATLPVYDVGAAASATLRAWARRDAAAEVLARGVAADAWLAPFREDTADADARRDGIVAACRDAPASTLLALRGAVLQALSERAQTAPLAAAIAGRLADLELYTAAVRRGEQRTALDALAAGDARLGTQERLALLAAAMERDDIASAALLRLGALLATEPRAEAMLWSALAHREHGASAAAALARHGDADTVRRLERLLDDRDGSEITRQRALLALRLMDLDAARAAVERHRAGAVREGEPQAAP